MTIVVGANPFGDVHAVLDLAVTLARTLPERGGDDVLVVATVIPPGWSAPSRARVDDELQDWVHARAEEAHAAALSALGERDDDLRVELVRLTDRSTPRALAALAQERDATALVLGSSPDGPVGRVVVGSTADYLLHSSPVPLVIAPRSYRRSPGADAAAHRLTCSFSGSSRAGAAVRWAARLTREIDVQLRVASFGVRSATMYPPEVGTDIESEVTEQWREQMAEAQAGLRATMGDLLDDDVELVVASGASWGEALSSIGWLPDELLVLGSSSAGALQRVFLGTNATKIIRHSPVPVLVVPHDEL